MNQHTLQPEDQHQRISLLLPWYLNQTLDIAERQQVETHLGSCILCRRELVNLSRLAEAVKQASDLQIAAEASFEGLRGKLQRDRQQPELSVVPQSEGTFAQRVDRTPGLSSRMRKRYQALCTGLTHWEARLAIAASLLLMIVPLVMQYGKSPDVTDYYTLSDTASNAGVIPQLRVVFAKSISDNNIDTLLEKVHGQRVAGPNSVGAYAVHLDSGNDSAELAAAIAFLRNQQDVVLAEPLLNPGIQP